MLKFKSLLTLAAGALLATTISASAALVITVHQIGPNTNTGGNTGVGAPQPGYGAYAPFGGTWSTNPTVSPGVSTTNQALSPFGGENLTPYFSVTTTGANVPPGANSPVTLTNIGTQNSLSNLIWGSIDPTNKIEFLSGASVVGFREGSQLLNTNGLGSTPGNQYARLSFLFNNGETFDSIRFSSGTVAYEFAAPVPLPAAAWLLVAGIGGLVIASRRRKA